jgi:hypothetical protein
VPIAVKDLEGEVRFYIDGEVAKDANGKTVAEPSSLRDLKDDEKLATLGNLLLRDRAGTPEGKQVLLDLAPGDVATAKTVAEFGAYVDGCIADEVCAPMFVPHDRGVWYVESPLDIIRIAAPYADGTGSPPVVSPSFKQSTFITNQYALAVKLPRRTVTNADWDLKARALRFLIEALRVRRELRVATLLMATATWNAANQITVAAGAQWNGGPGADPLNDVFLARAAVTMPATHLIISENVAPYFFAPGANSRVRDFVQAGGKLPNVLQAGALYANAGVNAYVWGTFKAGVTPVNVPLIRVSPDPTMIQTARTFRWLGDGASPDGVRKEGVLVRSFFDPRDECDWIVCSYNDFDTLLTPNSAQQAGSLIVGALQ